MGYFIHKMQKPMTSDIFKRRSVGKNTEAPHGPAVCGSCLLLDFVAQGLSEHWTVKESQHQTVPHQHNLRTVLVLPYPGSCAQQGGGGVYK